MLFDSQSFLNASLDAANATKRDPLPAGETIGQITKQEIVTGEAGPKAANPGKPWYKLNATIELADPDYLLKAKREKATITYGVMIDINEGGGLAMGPNTNVQLGKLREATGVNQPGKSLADMVGQWVRVTIGHRPNQDDPSIVYDEVKAVAKM